MTYHAFHVPDDDVIPIVTMSWWDVRATFHVYTMDGSRPTVQKYAEKRVVQVAGLEAWFAETEFSVSFVPNTTARGGVLYVGVLELGAFSVEFVIVIALLVYRVFFNNHVLLSNA